jgi:arginine decarboxylase
VSAALAWSRSAEGGLFYETAGEIDREDAERRVREGLAAGQALRDWEFAEPRVAVESGRADPGRYTTAVVLATYGEGDPIV